MKRLLLAALLLTPAWGEPQPVAVPTPAEFRGAADPGDSLGNWRWFEMFQDPQLQALIQIALTNNTDLGIALARIEAARANLRETGAEQFPQVGLSAAIQHSVVSTSTPLFPPGGVLPRQRTFGEVLLNLLSFELDLWGRLHHQTQAAARELVATEEDRRAVISLVISEVATTYFNLVELDAELELARRTLELRRQSLELIRIREAGGVGTMLDVRQGEQLVLLAEQTIPDLERRIVQTENRLQVLLGQTPGQIPRGRILAHQTSPPTVPAGLPSELLLRRPDIRAAEQRIAARGETIEYVRRSYFPRISLSGLLGFQSSSLSNLFTSPSRTMGIVPQLLVPIFSAGRGADTDLAQANLQIAREEYRQTVLTAFREVSDALVDYQKIREVRDRQQQLVATLQDRVRLAYLRYQGGVDTLLNALDADRDLFTAQLSVAQSRRNELLALVQLYRALGGGWAADQTPLPGTEQAPPQPSEESPPQPRP